MHQAVGRSGDRRRRAHLAFDGAINGIIDALVVAEGLGQAEAVIRKGKFVVHRLIFTFRKQGNGRYALAWGEHLPKCAHILTRQATL